MSYGDDKHYPTGGVYRYICAGVTIGVMKLLCRPRTSPAPTTARTLCNNGVPDGTPAIARASHVGYLLIVNGRKRAVSVDTRRFSSQRIIIRR